MIRIANWSQKHIAIARLLIVLLHLLTVLCAVQLSHLLAIAGVPLSFGLLSFITVTGVTFIVVIGYWRKRLSCRLKRMQWQKLRFFLTGIVCTVLLMGLLQNTGSKAGFTSYVQAAFTKTEQKKMPVYRDYSDKKLFYEEVKAYYHSLSKKELRKVLSYQVRHLNKISDTLETAIAILLIGFAASAALGLIAVLSCSLAYSGQGALAVFVLIGGTAGIVALLILLGKAYRKQKRKRAAEEPSKEPTTIPSSPEA